VHPVIKTILPGLLLVAAFYIQLVAQTNWRLYYGPYWNPVIWLLAGLTFSVVALHIGRQKALIDHIAWSNNKFIKISLFIVGAITYIIATEVAADYLDWLFKYEPINIEKSDVIPAIQTYTSRFLNGESVYEPIQFPGYISIPTYLPFMWLPYTIAEYWNFDYRWISFWSFVVAQTILMLTAWYRTRNAVFPFIFTVACAGVLYYLSMTYRANMAFGAEMLPSAYYLILCMALFSKRSWVVALGILLCLLSRYSFLFWLPLAFFILWKSRNLRFVLRVGIYVFVGVLLLYIIPFIGTDFHKITDGIRFYSGNASTAWQAGSFQPDGSIPYHLKQGLGLAIFFYEIFEPDVAVGVSVIRKLQLIAVFLFLVLFGWGYSKRLKDQIPVGLALVVSLHIYLLIFYSLLYSTYGYLFFVPLVAGLGVLWGLCRQMRMPALD